ncbi:MAG: arsenate reductase (glutaredoxin) [Gammaproteobacteria bacterium]|nr:arsenate reductase (glutaredoxin) [Gammaproteobacteria bacterium]
MTVTLYHNPRCSKSRATLGMLRDRGLEPDIILYLETPPDQAALRNIIEMLGISPRQLLRTSEKEYGELGLADPALSDDRLIEAICSHPRLMQRPIVLNAGKARIGRPPESVIDIL